MTIIRLFLVEEHLGLRHSLRALLAEQPGLRVVGEASSGPELLARLPTTPADVVLLGLNQPGRGEVETAGQLRAHYPAVQVLVLSVLDAPASVSQLLDAGARGYLLKSDGFEELVHGIRTVAAGRIFLCSGVGLAALHGLREGTAVELGISNITARAGLLSNLTKRETEVLELIAEGLTNQQIADQLFASKRTVETHRQRLITKTRMKNTASLIRFAVREGLVTWRGEGAGNR